MGGPGQTAPRFAALSILQLPPAWWASNDKGCPARRKYGALSTYGAHRDVSPSAQFVEACFAESVSAGENLGNNQRQQASLATGL